MRAEHSLLTIPPPPPRDIWEEIRWFFGGRPKPIVTYHFGGPGTFVVVRVIPSGYPGYTSDSDATEWLFSVEKSGGGAINSGDQVSIRIDSSRANIGPFYFRATSGFDQALIGADGVAPFQPDTLFVIEFHEVDLTHDPGDRLRPPAGLIVCQTCGHVKGTVTDAATGGPISGASVTAQGVLENRPFSGTTGSDGKFRLIALIDGHVRDCIPPGEVRLRAYADRYVPRLTSPIPDPSFGGADVPISLECTKVRGKVEDNNVPPNPQAFVDVILILPDGTTRVVTTAVDGTFVFDCVPHGLAEIWTRTLPQNQQVDVLPEGIDVKIVVPKNCVEIIGTVTDKFTGLPICKATVSYFLSSNSSTTDAQGKFKIPCASSGGSKTLVAAKAGYKLILKVVSPFPATGVATQDIQLEPTTGSIPGLFNTGVDACGTPLPDGTIGDPHYQLLSVPGGTSSIRVRTAAGGYPIPPYIDDNLISAWIVPDNDAQGDGPVGQYVYRIAFYLTGFDLSTVTIAGKWCTDNDGVRIELNGVDTGTPPTSFTQFELGFAPFGITTGFQPGKNTLDFIVNNGDGPTGLRVEMTSTATASSP